MLGPFDVSSDRIVALKAAFTPFVNRLLETEVRAAGIRQHLLKVTQQENTPDGGVDAALRDSAETDYIPPGDSAWQFKRSDPGPSSTADELAKAAWAHEIVKGGGSYVLVVGTELNDKQIGGRQQAVFKKALDLKLLSKTDTGRVRVYDANLLARWSSEHPALAVSKLAGGPGAIAVDFETWAAGRSFAQPFAIDSERADAIQTIRDQVSSPGVVEMRVQGESGIGKTRLVLEALRDERFARLVVYVYDEHAIDGELLGYLIQGDRTAILVVDECSAERHIKLRDRLPNDPAIKLITIGDVGNVPTPKAPVLAVLAVPEKEREEFLSANYEQLSPEGVRFVSEHGKGNMRWTIDLADKVVGADGAQAADLIARNDIEQFVTDLLPEGRGFFCSAVLALFERIGWDRELGSDLEILADFADVSVEELRSAGAALEERDLLSRQGRYRAVSPHPLAVYLAAEAWRDLGPRVVDELLPQLSETLTLALFRRAADLGQFGPAQVLTRLLETQGSFGSLASIEASPIRSAMIQLAIVLPDRVAPLLSELVESESLEVLRSQTHSRRDLVWALEKLAWHSRTFELGAGALLRLALAENERYANNATGTWLDLFGTMLPGTAASPEARIAYLRSACESEEVAERRLAVDALARALVVQETISVSGELQGGVLVEPRGRPATFGDVGEYRGSAVELLEQLRVDENPEVRSAADDALIGALHPLVGQWGWDALADALCRLEGESLRSLRRSLAHVLSLYERREPTEERREEEEVILHHLRALEARLPAQSPFDALETLVRMNRWDYIEEAELASRIEQKVGELKAEGPGQVLELLAEELPAAWELGRALRACFDKADADPILSALVDAWEANPSALVGYLSADVERGHESAFDDFLAGPMSAPFGTPAKLAVAVRGPVTTSSRQRILDSAHELPVSQAAATLFGWQRNLDEAEVALLLEDWLSRLGNQADYDAAVDWIHLWMHGRDRVPDSLRETVWQLLLKRSEYPDVSRRQWDWGQLASGFVDDHAAELGSLILDLIESESGSTHKSDEESRVLIECVRRDPESLWTELSDRLTAESWRIQITIRGWLLAAFPVSVVADWMGDNIERGRLVASLTSPGASQPTDLAKVVLDRFGDDEQVRGSLAAEFYSGFWSGNESDRIAGQIEQLSAWRADKSLPARVRDWARWMIEGLDRRREQALEREAEEHF